MMASRKNPYDQMMADLLKAEKKICDGKKELDNVLSKIKTVANKFHKLDAWKDYDPDK